MNYRLWIILPILVLLLGCTESEEIGGNQFKEAGPEPSLFFCKQDDCEQQLVSIIDQAAKSVHCAFYDFKSEKLKEALVEKSQNLDVKIVLDGDNDKGLLQGEGVRFDTTSQLMHNKFCIIDSSFIWTGSYNPTERGNTLNENHALLLSSHYLSKNYEKEFWELWDGTFSGGEPTEFSTIIHNEYVIENLFCPEDKCEERVVELLTDAEKSAYILLFSFTSEKIADALLFNTNIDIKGIFDSSQAGSQYSQFSRLEGFNLNVTKDKNKGKLHHKVFIIDEKIVLLGSYNPTWSGGFKNDENILIIHNRKIAKEFLEEFERLWSFTNS